MSFRITTNGSMRLYKSNLMKSYNKLTSAGEKVMTNRKFNSYAEDPASASQAFQMRRTLWLTESQLTNNNAVSNTYDVAWKAIDKVQNDLGYQLGKVSDLRGLNGPTGSGRQPLGQTLLSTAESMVQTMNSKYGDRFVFAGADGLNVPLSWSEDGQMLYRGIPVNVHAAGQLDENGNDLGEQVVMVDGKPLKDVNGNEIKEKDAYNMLKAMSEETTYVDLGMGLAERNGTVVQTSAFNSALSGLNYLNYGMDEDGDPKNLVMLTKKLGEIFSNCDPDSGAFVPASDEDVANRLTDKLEAALSDLTVEYVALDTEATFLKTNTERLTSTKDTLNEQITQIEDMEGADAITSFAWANYCYNAALKIGNSILSQSLIDYMQ